MPSSPAPSNHTDKTALPNNRVYQPPFYYQFAISLLKPLYRLQVWRRSHQRDNYQQEVDQRFGKSYPKRPTAADTVAVDVVEGSKASESMANKDRVNKGIIWCHAVSLGETNTVAPLLDKLLAQGYGIWLTNTTQTGFTRGASRFADEIAQGLMSHSYVPVDSPAVIARFLAHVQPSAALFVETELWANILTTLSERHIPSILVNGRLSASSFNSYQKIAAVSTSMMKNLALIIAQDNESAKRFRQLGADSAKIRVAGSLKWVINTPKADAGNSISATNTSASHISATNTSASKQPIENAIEASIAGRPVWVAASTHGGEEEVALSLQQQLLSHPALANPLLIIVPRHPERFDEVAALIQTTELITARRSADQAIDSDTQVYLADSMGELMTWYELADAALVGGSLVEIGGHNPVEPASVATAVLMGPYTQSCQSVVDKLAEVGALYQPYNEHYQPVSTHQAQAETSAITSQKISGTSATHEQVSVEATALIYQQLVAWLSDIDWAKQSGQAGAQMTMQQQAVLTHQLTMIEDVIEQYS